MNDETKQPEGAGETPPIETKVYMDGTSATGAAPLPNLSPDQQDVAAAGASIGTGASAALEGDIPLASSQPATDVPAAAATGTTSDASAKTLGDHVNEGKSIIAAMREHVSTENAHIRLKYHAWLDKLEAVFHRI